MNVVGRSERGMEQYMGARTGEQYLEGLRDDRAVWLGAERVDVLSDERFTGSLQGMSEYFDYQHRYADGCLGGIVRSTGWRATPSGCSAVHPTT
jgi:hypothetical protein